MELDTTEALRLVEQLHRAGVFQINFGGGEPFLRPDFETILDACHERGMMTCISTNGTLVTPRLAARLARSRLVAIQISIDGASSETCDTLRGAGVFDKAIEAARLLAATSIPTSINAVLTKRNAAEIPAMHLLARSLGISLRVSRFRPSGRGADNWEELRPTPAQLLEFADWLAASGDVRTGDSFFSLTSQQRQGMGLNLCGAAKLTCCVGPTGDMYPCAFLQSERFRGGSLRNSTFIEIWNVSEIYRSFRKLRVVSCEACHRFDVCHGGCPAVAWHLKQDLGAADPECLEKCVTTIADADGAAAAA